jgi:hypothetical protein
MSDSRKIAVEDMDIGAAYAAGLDPDEQVAGAWPWVGPLLELERPARGRENHGLQGRTPSSFGVTALRRPLVAGP